MSGGNVIPINALFDTSGVALNLELPTPPGELLTDAELIFGRDVMSKNQFLVYGRELLEEIVASNEEMSCATLVVELDQETDDLERLLALVSVVKGRHDYH